MPRLQTTCGITDKDASMKFKILKLSFLLAGLSVLASCTIIEPPSRTYPPATRVPTTKIPEVQPSATTSRLPLPENPKPAQAVVVKPAIEAEEAKNPYDDVPPAGNARVAQSNSSVASTSATSPAVKGLLNQAKVAMANNENSSAVGKLERALRIEPRNPTVWHQLAKAHFNEGKDGSAISMAKKSNLYVNDNSPLERMNWQLIKTASKRSGDIKTLKDAIRYERNHPQ